MKMTRSNQFGKLKEDRLKAFETKLSAHLPHDYKKFLLEHNGGSPESGCLKLPEVGETRIHNFYGLNDGPDYQKLDVMAEVFARAIPKGILPIAADPFGNQICIGMEDHNFGKIFFWDHERECEPESVAFLQVSNSFLEFISGLFECQSSDDLVIEAIKNNDISRIIDMIGSGYNIEAVDKYGRTAMENAAIFNKPQIVRALHDHGAKLKNALEYALGNLEFFPDQEEVVKEIKRIEAEEKKK